MPYLSTGSARRFHTGGLIMGVACFCASFLPSMLPRSWLKQGTVTGLSLAIGYGLGVLVFGLFPPVRKPMGPRWFGWWIIGAACIGFVVLGVGWEGQLRHELGIEPLQAWEPLAAVGFSVLLFRLLLAGGRSVRTFAERAETWLGRYLSPRLATFASLSFSVILVVGVVQGVMIRGTFVAVSATYRMLSQQTSEWITVPESSLRSGSSESLVPWETLGRHGREFVGSGPTSADIGDFTGSIAKDPIRVYVGVDSAATLDERVDLLVSELERVGAFGRAHLAIITATGTGWVDETAAEAFEFLHGGDTALAVMQYSHTPSWVLFFGDGDLAAETTEAMVRAVTVHLAEWSPTDRPHLSVFGESLGALGVVAAFEDEVDLLARTDSALLVGAPHADPIRAALLEARDPRSPRWLPVIKDRPEIVFATGPDDLAGADAEIVYLLYTSDPVGYASFDLIFARPEWLEPPRGPDLSPIMTWIPVISFLQSLGDVGFAMDVPQGHGHHYGPDIVDAWVALDAPPGWTEHDTARLRDVVQDRQQERELRAGT